MLGIREVRIGACGLVSGLDICVLSVYYHRILYYHHINLYTPNAVLGIGTRPYKALVLDPIKHWYPPVTKT